jgi:chromosomal replication initiation ATPase DnaA
MTPRVRQYIAEIAFWHGLPAAAIIAPSRARGAVMDARTDVMRRLHDNGFSTSQIGRWLQRDHSTVIYHLRARP